MGLLCVSLTFRALYLTAAERVSRPGQRKPRKRPIGILGDLCRPGRIPAVLSDAGACGLISDAAVEKAFGDKI